jgi:hypothetical protein
MCQRILSTHGFTDGKISFHRKVRIPTPIWIHAAIRSVRKTNTLNTLGGCDDASIRSVLLMGRCPHGLVTSAPGRSKDIGLGENPLSATGKVFTSLISPKNYGKVPKLNVDT